MGLLGSVDLTFPPTAVISGFTRPSFVGPRELKFEMFFASVVEPTVRMFFGEASNPTEPNGVCVGCRTIEAMRSVGIEIDSRQKMLRQKPSKAAGMRRVETNELIEQERRGL